MCFRSKFYIRTWIWLLLFLKVQVNVNNTSLYPNCGATGKLFRCFELAQLTEGGLGHSKPATNLIESTVTHCVEYFYYIQALESCLL